MRTFYIWKLIPGHTGPIGPWQYQSAIAAEDEKAALEAAKARHGFAGEYKVYEGFE